MIKQNIALLLHPSLRGRAFIQNMFKRSLIPSEILVMEGVISDSAIPPNIEAKGYFEPYEEPVSTLTKNKINFELVPSLDCNNEEVIRKVKALKSRWVIFSGGGILRKPILSLGKNFIHVHPGKLPQYRGSTCFYYSFINEDKCFCSAFIMENTLDSGKILFTKEFKPPRNIDFDFVYDPWIRSDTICDLIESVDFNSTPHTKINSEKNSEMYYIIHPVLKHLAIMKNNELL